MPFRVRVRGINVVLPNGNMYQNNDEVILTDDQYLRLDEALIGSRVTVLEVLGTNGVLIKGVIDNDETPDGIQEGDIYLRRPAEA